MIRSALIIAGSLLTVLVFGQSLQVNNLSCEHLVNPIGIDITEPRLSWKITAAARNTMQTAYEIRVADNIKMSGKNLVWQTGKLSSGESILQKYEGSALKSGTRYYWQVKVWDNMGHASAWSAPAFWEMGMLNKADWKATWIEPVQDTLRMIPALELRKEFAINKKIAAARVYVTSHGMYKLYLNGNKVGNDELTPGWTSYNTRLQYQVYDITTLVQQGKNAVGAMVGDGWYRGSLAWDNNWAIYGKTLGLLCQLTITYTDGSTETVASDETWKSTQNGPVVKDGIYYGEDYDARKETTGWMKTGYDDSKWQAVKVANHSLDNLVAMNTVPVRTQETIAPIKIFKTPKGTLVADMGQNMVGWIKLKVKGAAGNTITIRHAEVLDKFGEFYTDNLRAATATTRYTMKGGSEETFEPHFTFYGFRYVAIDGFPGELTPENITGVVVHSDMTQTGSFACSDSLINQLQHNIRWGQKGNFLDVPTDCPQRDERLGWTGDAQAFCRTAAFNMNVAPFFTKWLKDLSADQYSDGAVPFVIPNVLSKTSETSAGWGDVSTIVPWTIYKVFGDKQILETQYPSMQAYVNYIRNKAGDSYLWKGGSVFGDWLFYKSMQQTENDGYTSPDMIATMFYAYSVELMSKTAHALGKSADEKMYTDLFEKIKDAFMKNYVTGEGRIASESQTSYVLALEFNLLPEDMRAKATGYLVADIKSRGNHLSTGFLGTPYLCHVLSANGRADVAYDLLMQQSFPSWLYPVKMGATTIWERWDGQKTDSTFQDVGMNSFNHYAYGAIGDWMYRVVAGIEIGEPGYKQILLQPTPTDKLSFAKASFESAYGTIASGWERKDGKMMVKFSIPANTTAIVKLPKATATGVMESNKVVQGNDAFKNIKAVGDDLQFEVGSGEYEFVYAVK
ncbi:glycoside hydrolase family 78 protein [soil metagenome]